MPVKQRFTIPMRQNTIRQLIQWTLWEDARMPPASKPAKKKTAPNFGALVGACFRFLGDPEEGSLYLGALALWNGYLGCGFSEDSGPFSVDGS